MQKHHGSLVWLIAWLSLGSAVWLASPRSAQNHAKANAPSLSAISGKKLSQDDRLSSSGNRLKSIERVEVGQRVATGISQEIRDLAIGDPLAVPQWDRLDHQIDSQTWRKLTLVMHTPQGDRFDITLLRPIGWLESCNARVGSSIHLVVSEQGLDGLADVLGIEPCPSISSGVGRVVTGTFTHVRGGILRIRLFGLAEPLGVTSNHSIYSADRLDFVPAGELRVGETLRNIDGDVRIESIEQLGSEERVYNLEIHGEHVFRVASSGVLVHNSSGVKAPRGTGIVDDIGTTTHKNSLDYVGDTHVYRIRGPEGTYKIGESAQGVRVRDSASIRGEQQSRRLTRETGDFYESEIRRTFPDKRSAREYETRLIERFRRMFGDDALPGNRTNR
jgi:hypothetical protein